MWAVLAWLGVFLVTPTAGVSTQRPLDSLAPPDTRDSRRIASALTEAETLEASLSPLEVHGQQQHEWQNGTDAAIPFLAVQLDSGGFGTIIEYAECQSPMSSMPGACHMTGPR